MFTFSSFKSGLWGIFLLCCACSPGIDGYVRQLNHSDVDVRVYGAEKLGESGNLSGVPHLIEALKDDKVRVRLTAIEALGKLKDKRATTALIPFLRDKRPLLIFSALDALGQIKDPLAVDSLVAFVNEGLPTFRLAGIDALGHIGDSTAVSALCMQVWDETPQVRWVSAMALGRIGNEMAVPYLVHLLSDDDQRVHEAALYALDQIDENWREQSNVALEMIALRGDLMQERVLGNDNALIRFRALQGLNGIDPNWREKPWVEDVVQHWCDWLVIGTEDEREVAARVLGDLKDLRGVSSLLAGIKDQDHGVRRQAILSLGKLGDRSVAGELKDLLNEDDLYVRGPIARALGDLRDTSAVILLNDLVDDDLLALRGGDVGGDQAFSIAVALGALNDKRGIPALLKLLKHRSGYVRSGAAQSLGQVGDPDTVPDLLKALNDGSRAVRWGVAKALGKMQAVHVVEPLIDRLGRDAFDDRSLAQALDQIESDWQERPTALKKIETIVDAFEQSKGEDRADAAVRLSYVGGSLVREALLEALRQRELDVIVAAHPFFIREYQLAATATMIQALDHAGDAKMATAMLASGRPRLEKAARHWAHVRGMALIAPPDSTDEQG